MKPVAAKEKSAQPGPSRSCDRASHVRAPRPARASGPTTSYLKTRIRGSRLLEAAFILAIAELSRRLHQAYRHAYDKQAAEWVLPQNPAQPQGAPCDQTIASIFGGSGAVAATVNEPSTLEHPAAGQNRYDHLAGNGVFHLYTNAQGTEATTGLYMPPGGRLVSGGEYYNGGPPEEGGKLENYFRFSYSRGPLKGVTLSFVHVGGTSGGEGGGQRLGRFPGQTNAAGSVRIGNIAGLGGASPGYNHSHIKVYLNGKLTDPRKVFCK